MSRAGAVLTAAVIFTATYVVVAVGRVPGLRLDRTGAAVVGAAFMIAFHVVSAEQAYRMVDLGTLVLLFGMMVVVAHLKLAGFFRWAGVAVARRARSPRQLLAGLVAVSGVLSALFVNDTVCLALTPLVLEVTAALGVRPIPYLLALATASNIGSVATLTGNPQNMLVGVASGIPYATFFRALAPVAAVGLRPRLRRDRARLPARRWRGRSRPPPTRGCESTGSSWRRGWPRRRRCSSSSSPGAHVSVVALTAGAALLLTRRVKPEKVFVEINWNLLTFFAGLFVVVGAAREAGLADRVFTLLHAREAHSTASLTLVSAILSNVVSNVPAVMLFTHMIPSLPDPTRAWLTLAMSSTLAGNLTLLGSIANLIVAEGARRTAPISFVGVPQGRRAGDRGDPARGRAPARSR